MMTINNFFPLLFSFKPKRRHTLIFFFFPFFAWVFFVIFCFWFFGVCFCVCLFVCLCVLFFFFFVCVCFVFFFFLWCCKLWGLGGHLSAAYPGESSPFGFGFSQSVSQSVRQ